MSGKSVTGSEQGLVSTMESVSSIVNEKFSLIWSINHFGDFLDRKYEFSSPVFTPNSPGKSKWKLAVFPEIVYPEGVQIVLRLFNMANEDKCYSVKYTISLLDKNGSDHVLQYREKVFRCYLDYDQCFVASNQTIKEKDLLESKSTLTICCQIDLFFCENPDDNTPESLKSYDNIGISFMDNTSMTHEKLIKSENLSNSPTLNDLSAINNNQTKSQNINNSSLAPNYLSSENTTKKSDTEVKVVNGLSEINDNVLNSASNLKMEKAHSKKESPKHHKDLLIFPDGCEKKTSGLSEKIDSFFHKTRDKTTKGKWNSKNLKDLDTLSKDLNFLYVTKYQNDVIICTVDGGQIRAHKAILAARSEYFRKILAQGKEEIQILEVSSDTLDAILFYLYTGQSPQMTFNLGMDILRICDLFQLDLLKGMAENSIKSQINISNVIDIVQTAIEMKLENLKIYALKFIAKNNDAVTNSAKWNEIISTNPSVAREILLSIVSTTKEMKHAKMIKENKETASSAYAYWTNN